MFNNLMRLDEHLRVVPDLADRLDNPAPTTYVATLRRGVRFHDGHELTSADVVYTFRCFLDPAFVSPLRGAYRGLQSVDAVDRYTVVFTLTEPFASFPINLVLPGIVPAGAGPDFREHPIGTGPYRFVRYAVDDQIELTAFDDYFGGRPSNDGLVLKVVPDDIMRGLELRKGTMDIVINDLAPDIVYQLRREPRLQVVESPGVDYQYVGLNLRDPILNDLRVRQAIAYAIDRRAIVEYLRRGLAAPAVGLLPPMSWAFEPGVFTFQYDPREIAGTARRSGLSRSGRRWPRAASAPDAQGVEHRVQPAAGGGHSAEPARRRHRARRAELRVRDAVRRRAEGQLSDVHDSSGPRGPSPIRTSCAASSIRGRCRLSASTAGSSTIRGSITCSTKPPRRPTRAVGAPCTVRSRGSWRKKSRTSACGARRT